MSSLSSFVAVTNIADGSLAIEIAEVTRLRKKVLWLCCNEERLRANKARLDACIRDECYKCAKKGVVVKCDKTTGDCLLCGLSYYKMRLWCDEIEELEREFPRLQQLDLEISKLDAREKALRVAVADASVAAETRFNGRPSRWAVIWKDVLRCMATA